MNLRRNGSIHTVLQTDWRYQELSIRALLSDNRDITISSGSFAPSASFLEHTFTHANTYAPPSPRPRGPSIALLTRIQYDPLDLPLPIHQIFARLNIHTPRYPSCIPP